MYFKFFKIKIIYLARKLVLASNLAQQRKTLSTPDLELILTVHLKTCFQSLRKTRMECIQNSDFKGNDFFSKKK